MDEDKLKKIIEQEMIKRNNQPIDDFVGYSAFEMHQLLYNPFGANSPLKLQDLSDQDYQQMPIFNLIKDLGEIIHSQGGLKLTAVGNLPVTVVTELYSRNYLQQEFPFNPEKPKKEADVFPVRLTRIIMELGAMTKIQKNKLTLTAKGIKLLNGKYKELFSHIFSVFTTKFNWAYYGIVDDEKIGQMGYAFTILLVSIYGHEKHTELFYAKIYFKAFPRLLDELQSRILSKMELGTIVYNQRVFSLFMRFFGLVKIFEVSGKVNGDQLIKTKLFDALFKRHPHREFGAKDL